MGKINLPTLHDDELQSICYTPYHVKCHGEISIRIPLLDVYINFIKNNQQYRYLWLSQIISQLGDWFNLIASATLISGLTGSGMAIGALFLARLLPPFLLGPIAGVVADRFDRRKILIISDLLRMVIVLGFLLVKTEQDVWLIYSLTVLQLSISAFFEPARAAIVPQIVERKDLITANALASVTWSSMLALGAALGGFATALFGVTIAFLLDSLTFIISAWFVSRLTYNATVLPQERTDDDADGGWQAFLAGLRYLRAHPPVLVVALLKASAAIGFGGMNVVELTFAEEIFPIGSDSSGAFGLILLVAGLGTGIGPIVARRITGDNLITMHWAILFTYIVSLIGFLLIGWSPILTVMLLGTFARTIGSGTNWVFSSSMLQIMVPSNYLGRVFAFDIAMVTLAAAISTLWVGWAKDNLGLSPHQISLALGIIPFIGMIGWTVYMMLRREA
ncbi:MFS transporter [Anaerolineales bacterium HSG24]|nr:MFS transporter [Anaerolineales bacterium HSG24]